MPILPQKANSEGNNETLDDRSPIAPGVYIAHIVRTEFKETKKKNGHYLSMRFTILEGSAKGRNVFTNLNLDNPNPVAVEIANKELNSICEACGMADVEDSDELLQVPLGIKVSVREATAQYPAANEIDGYMSEDDARAEIGDEVAPASDGGDSAEPEKTGGLPWE